MVANDIAQIQSNTQLDDETINNSLKQYEIIRRTYNALFDEDEYKQLQKEGHRRLSQ